MSLPLEPSAAVGQGVTEQTVAFSVQNETVRGTLARPDRPADLGVVLVHGWSGNRTGPHGLLKSVARAIARDGCPSLRFDFRGRGESEGDGLHATLITMADDLVAASRVLVEKTAVRRLVYVGMCSGGNVTIGALRRLPAADGLVLLSVYPFSDGDAFARDVHRTWHYARVYWNKARQKETWTRLFRGDVHLLQVLNVLFGHFVRRDASRKKEGRGPQEPQEKPEERGQNRNPTSKAAGRTAVPARHESRKDNGNAPRKHLANLRKDLPALMIYGAADPDAPAAKRYFGDYAAEHSLPVTIVDIEGANHNFSSAQWKRRIEQMTVEFCRTLA